MPKDAEKSDPADTEFSAFQDAMRKMIQVPKATMDAALADEKQKRMQKRKERKRGRSTKRPDESP